MKSNQVKVIKSKLVKEEEKVVLKIIHDGFKNSDDLKVVSEFIKKTLDANCGMYWQVVIGKSFTTYITHEEKKDIYVEVGPYRVQAFKLTVA